VLGPAELDQARDVLQKLWRELLLPKDSGRHGKPNRRLQMIRRVLLPSLPRGALMKLMDQIVKVGGGDFALLPGFEMRPEIEERLAQLAVVGDGRPFSNKTCECAVRKRSPLLAVACSVIRSFRLQPVRGA
jgi:hypothetical protein